MPMTWVIQAIKVIQKQLPLEKELLGCNRQIQNGLPRHGSLEFTRRSDLRDDGQDSVFFHECFKRFDERIFVFEWNFEWRFDSKVRRQLRADIPEPAFELAPFIELLARRIQLHRIEYDTDRGHAYLL
jgi:hypothetical protein